MIEKNEPRERARAGHPSVARERPTTAEVEFLIRLCAPCHMFVLSSRACGTNVVCLGRYLFFMIVAIRLVRLRQISYHGVRFHRVNIVCIRPSTHLTSLS